MNHDTGEPPARSTSLRRNKSKSSQHDGKPKRQRSLVRPERERNDPNNRLYHYRQRAGQTDDLAPSTTGNAPLNPPPPIPIVQNREQFLRRGKSILGREEKAESTGGAITFVEQKQSNSGCNLWMTYCIILTCCIPKQFLRCVGKSYLFLKKKPLECHTNLL